MEFLSCLSVLMHLVCFCLKFHILALNSLSRSVAASCHQGDMSALLEFKSSFDNVSLSGSKLESWRVDRNNQTSSDCCLWEGIECDEGTGHVIALDLGGGNLSGSINSSSSLFQLVHLLSIDLSGNNFGHSPIPSGFGSFSRLTHLDLSRSSFSGQIPPDIFTLTSLVSLDLSNSLELPQPGLTSLAQNLTNLQSLILSGVSILSPVPHIFANLSSLSYLFLDYSGVFGAFPASIFQMPNLEVLTLNYNKNLTILLPEFNSSSPLKELNLLGVSLSGELPPSIGNLQSLERLQLGTDNCNLTGSIPSSVGKLHSLRDLTIRECKLTGSIPSSFGNLTELTFLDLLLNPFTAQNFSSFSWLWKLSRLQLLTFGEMNLQGEIPSHLGNMSQLVSIELGGNSLKGPIPSQLMNLGQLRDIRLAGNELSGHIPSWISNMTQLISVSLACNRLQGPVPSWITQLPSLTMLHLSWNQFNGTVEQNLFFDLNSSSSATYTNLQFFTLGLASCSLQEFPAFLQNHPNLGWLDLSHNNIHEVPMWMQNIGVDSLFFLNLSDNCLTGLNSSPKFLPWNVLETLDLSSNKFTGSPPAIPTSAKVQRYLVSKNELTGTFPPWICNWSSLAMLDLSFNNLNGALPECLGNISPSLAVINLQGNRFTGNIPQLYASGLHLKMFALGHNNLQGPLPRSLANCSQLEFIDLGNNQINDTFPSWLESLQELAVLILSHNKFRGVINTSGFSSGFKSLRIIDLSHNTFTGLLPKQYLGTLSSMMIAGPAPGEVTYLQASLKPVASIALTYYGFYDFYMMLVIKGLDMYYPKVSEIFTAIDLSGNKFEGGIPDVIGNLKQLHSLNLSNNFLSGHIPSSMGNLSQLESLDLSLNRLSGEIPQELADLNFLAVLNLSYNNLSGGIPRGKQFNTFTEISFRGNPGLCGDAISRKCISSEAETPEPSSSKEEEDSLWFKEFDWKIVLMGFGSGLVIGGVIGNAFTERNHGWFSELVVRLQQKWRRQTRRRRN